MKFLIRRPSKFSTFTWEIPSMTSSSDGNNPTMSRRFDRGPLDVHPGLHFNVFIIL